MFEPDAKLAKKGMELFDNYVSSLTINSNYFLSHRDRYEKTFNYIPKAKIENSRAIELGATGILQVALKFLYGYEHVAGSDYMEGNVDKLYEQRFKIEQLQTVNKIFNINLESELLPFSDNSIDLILCCELIEHLDIDPMFMLAEINRVSKMGAYLLITTPNSCSARNYMKISQGYRPHFYMQYDKSRSPYRHNIEYDAHTLELLSYSAGFETVLIETHDVFEKPVPEALEILKKNNFPLENRGDNIYLLSKKVSQVNERWPEDIYSLKNF